jgi:hypothetical protein
LDGAGGSFIVGIESTFVVLFGRGQVDRSVVGLRLLHLCRGGVLGRRCLCATTFDEKEDGQTDEDERQQGTADDHAQDPRLKCGT